MATVEIPLSNTTPSFSFSTELDSRKYNFQFRYLGRLGIWTFDILDDQKVMIQAGIPFQVDIDLLWQNRNNDRPAGTLYCTNEKEIGTDSGRFELGADVKFLYIEAE